MNTTKPILECVPNFSEGSDTKKINAIADVIKKVKGVQLLQIDSSHAANRTVMTFAGEPKPVIEAAFKSIKKAGELIDMRLQNGVHPRIGATDVCPLVPLYNLSIHETNEYAKKLGERVGNELKIPVYLYEYSATQEHRRALPNIRKGDYKGFAEKIKLPQWQPDYGPNTFNKVSGATVIGARDILVAFNISLNTNDVTKANYIAQRIREKGFTKKTDGQSQKVKGLLPKVRAIGWYMADYDCAQVSFNLLEFHKTSPIMAWQTCEILAKEIDVKLTGSEVIGLIPEKCLIEAGATRYPSVIRGKTTDIKTLIQDAIELMGLHKFKKFDPEEKILEYALFNAGLIA